MLIKKFNKKNLHIVIFFSMNKRIKFICSKNFLKLAYMEFIINFYYNLKQS
jgi:hypothetical protein